MFIYIYIYIYIWKRVTLSGVWTFTCWNIRHFLLNIASFNMYPAWHIDDATNKKKTYDFYKVPTFRWHVSKFKRNRIFSLQIIVIQVKLLLQIFETMKKSEFCVLIKHWFLIRKNFKKSNDLTSLIRTLLCQEQRWGEDILTLNGFVQTQMMLNAKVTQIRQ